MGVGAMGEAIRVLDCSERAAHRLPGVVLLGDEPMTKKVFEQSPHQGVGGEHTGVRVPEMGVEAAKERFLLEPAQTLHDPAANQGVKNGPLAIKLQPMHSCGGKQGKKSKRRDQECGTWQHALCAKEDLQYYLKPRGALGAN
jgi:hypothetical protein